MTSPLAAVFAPAGVTVSCGDLELRWISDDDLPALIEVALAGVHDEGFMPFMSPWTKAPRSEIPANTARFIWHQRARCTPEEWKLNFGCFHQGRIIGVQEVVGRNFRLRRVVETGSWLGLQFQGQGLGTLMRQMGCALAFDQLGAVECRSGAYSDNPKSLGVSRKVGYQIVDTTRETRDDERGWQTHHVLKLTPEQFVRPIEPINYSGVEEFKAFIGL